MHLIQIFRLLDTHIDRIRSHPGSKRTGIRIGFDGGVECRIWMWVWVDVDIDRYGSVFMYPCVLLDEKPATDEILSVS